MEAPLNFDTHKWERRGRRVTGKMVRMSQLTEKFNFDEGFIFIEFETPIAAGRVIALAVAAREATNDQAEYDVKAAVRGTL